MFHQSFKQIIFLCKITVHIYFIKFVYLLIVKQLKGIRILFFTNDIQIIFGDLKISSRMHYLEFGVRKKSFISETNTNMIHCKMDWLSICDNVLNKLLIQGNFNYCISNNYRAPSKSQQEA